jgi:glycosyltransferase involved in cell wall biosynthesis
MASDMSHTEAGRVHVLHVVTRLPVGGVENMLLKVVQRYDRRRFRVSICCIQEGGEIADELQRLGFTVLILGRMKGRGFEWGAVRDLYYLIRKERIDILRTHQYHANLYGRIAGIMARVPVMVPSFHNLYRSPSEPKMHRRLFNILLSFFSARLVAVSGAVAADIRKYDHVAPRKIQVIHNGVIAEQFGIGITREGARQQLGVPPDGFFIGTAGRLSGQKGQGYLIEAAAGLDASVLIAGDGPLRNELEERARKLGSRCRFLGMLRPEQMPLFMKSLDLFCFPSLWEGLPSALAEAITAGLPVVASDIPSNREVLGNAAVLVSAGDSEGLRKALQEVMGSTELMRTLHEKALQQSKQFSIEHTVKAYEDLFMRLLKEKGLA